MRWKRSPSVRNRVWSLASAMRQPKCTRLANFGFWLKTTFTSSSFVASSDSRAEASAVELPPWPGSEKQK